MLTKIGKREENVKGESRFQKTFSFFCLNLDESSVILWANK